MIMKGIVKVDGLVKKYGDLTAVNEVSFNINKGEVFALLGPNGAGKTTTIHVIATVLRPTSGNVFVGGYNVVSQADKVRRMIGIVFQDPSLDDQLTAYDNMYIHGRLYGLKGESLREKIMRLLEYVELKEYAWKKTKYFSGGMRRRLEIARSLLHEPELLILDEPTIGLDPQSRSRIWEYIRDLLKEYDMTVLMTTHYMDEAEELASRIAIMDHGKIIAQGTSDELKSLIGEEVVHLKVDGEASDLCDTLDFVGECRVLGKNGLELVVKNASRIIPLIFEKTNGLGTRITEVSYKKPSLNDVFLYLTGRELREELEQPSVLSMLKRRRFRR